MNIKSTPNGHPHEDVFEEYIFERLSDDEIAEFEEHLLICERCQNMLAKTDEHIQLMQAATAVYVATDPSPRSTFYDRGLHRNVAAAAVLLLTCLTALLSWRTPSSDPKTIVLEAYRGNVLTVSRAPAGQPLDFEIDLKDVRPAAGYRIEVVNATGSRVWFGGTPAHVSKGLPEGSYWVRLFTDGGELLREFALRAE